MFRSYDHLQAEIYTSEINVNVNFRLKMVVRPKYVADNLNKIVNNYWNRVALDGNRWTWNVSLQRCKALFEALFIVCLLIFVLELCCEVCCIQLSLVWPLDKGQEAAADDDLAISAPRTPHGREVLRRVFADIRRRKDSLNVHVDIDTRVPDAMTRNLPTSEQINFIICSCFCVELDWIISSCFWIAWNLINCSCLWIALNLIICSCLWIALNLIICSCPWIALNLLRCIISIHRYLLRSNCPFSVAVNLCF
jgi:hypothetical protein